ncbi:helix-turn-helix protein [Streptomyces sp. 2333.5]|uniref:helix-turn-helix domain-containing protein n=1 Tax=unclassified Streptomyces TaxID=2593676 RepID=UPI000897E8F5|nr:MULTISPECIES: helix-turn-helix transcriptional regulator [unclassified Streptomyces]PJJ01038.1 helix-turn-helix protein [Streptomyces sp. 2333.5]SEC34122.1 Helix-turn-helix domain-containing protein [Streptomyces sp. 2314.4]SED16646.1 Helix-turn-helix domain-containing protein [Streptomyces sp. 2112.2]
MPPRRAVTGRSKEPRKRFAEEVRLLRAQKGDSLRKLGEVLGWDASLFGKMESGKTIGSPEVVEALAQHYGAEEWLLTLWELAVGDPAQFKEQYRRYMSLEQEAMSLWKYSVRRPPGLLQTPAYAREALAAGGHKGKELDQQVNARVDRRNLLEGDDPPPFRVILCEAVLRNSLRDPREWQEQLQYLVDASERPNITLHVLPFDTGLHGLDSTDVMFLRLLDGSTVAYVETDVRGELIEENDRVERLQRTYDAVRDLALSPAESQKFITRLLEEMPCEPST